VKGALELLELMEVLVGGLTWVPEGTNRMQL